MQLSINFVNVQLKLGTKWLCLARFAQAGSGTCSPWLSVSCCLPVGSELVV